MSHFYWFITCLSQQILPVGIFRQLCLQNCRQGNGRFYCWESFWNRWGQIFNKCCIMIEFVYTADFIQLKVITVKNALLATIGFSTVGLNIKILLVMSVIICWCYVFILVILLLSLLKVLIIAVLFMALVNLLQLFYYKIFCLIVAIHKKYSKEIIIKNKSLTIMAVSSNQKK